MKFLAPSSRVWYKKMYLCIQNKSKEFHIQKYINGLDEIKFCNLWQQYLKDFGGFIGDQIKNGNFFAPDSTIGIQSNKEENGQCQKDLWKFLSLCQKIVNSFVWNWLMEDWGILTWWWFLEGKFVWVIHKIRCQRVKSEDKKTRQI